MKFISEKYVDLKILDPDFFVENVNFAPKKAKTMSDPQVKEDWKKLQQAYKTESPLKYFKGPFHRPVTGRQTGYFGSERRYKGKRLWLHKGVDFAVPVNTEVHAAANGVVILTGSFVLPGQTVVIDHGLGILTVYIHLNSILVKSGQKVVKGEVIAKSGSTGLTTGPNLHWGLYVHSEVVDPLKWLEK